MMQKITHNDNKGFSRIASIIVVLVVLASAIIAGIILLRQSAQPSTTSSTVSSTSQTIQGIVAGYVTVGPSQPVCSTNESCTVNMTGYSLEFTSQCPNATSTTSCQAQTYYAKISPGGHYSILLSPGPYAITGLSPSCKWVGCASAFPRTVLVDPGQQIVVNVDIDTGIR